MPLSTEELLYGTASKFAKFNLNLDDDTGNFNLLQIEGEGIMTVFAERDNFNNSNIVENYIFHLSKVAEPLILSFQEVIADLPEVPEERGNWFIEFKVAMNANGVSSFTGEHTYVQTLINEIELWDSVGSDQTYYRLQVYLQKVEGEALYAVSSGGIYREDIFTQGGLPVVGLIKIA